VLIAGEDLDEGLGAGRTAAAAVAQSSPRHGSERAHGDEQDGDRERERAYVGLETERERTPEVAP
jgi:ribosomal protein L12E/L44/L45/RPP1/RPP2